MPTDRNSNQATYTKDNNKLRVEEPDVTAPVSALQGYLNNLNQQYRDERSNDTFKPYILGMIPAGAISFLLLFLIGYSLIPDQFTTSLPFSAQPETNKTPLQGGQQTQNASASQKFEFSFILGISGTAAAAIALAAAGGSAVQQQNDKLSALSRQMDHVRERIDTIELDEAIRRRHLRVTAAQRSPLYAEIADNVEKKNIPRALERIESALAYAPNDSILWNLEGVSLGIMRRYEDARQALETAIRLEPTNPDAWYNRAIALFGLGNYGEAITSLENALRLNPNDMQAHNLFGVIRTTTSPDEQLLASLPDRFRIPSIVKPEFERV